MNKLQRQQRALSSVLSEHVDSFFIVATTPTGEIHGFQKFSSPRDKVTIEAILEKYFIHKIESDQGNFDDE